jgi:hypothetical protein
MRGGDHVASLGWGIFVEFKFPVIPLWYNFVFIASTKGTMESTTMKAGQLTEVNLFLLTTDE